LRMLGADDLSIDVMKDLSQSRLTPEMIMRLWVRNKEVYEPLWKDLQDQGVDLARISFLKELAWAVPTAGEVVNFAAKEAFEDEMAAFYGLDDEFEAIDQKWFDMAGVKEEARPLYWRAHWQHPALQTVFNLLHRGLITEAEVERYYRVVEIPTRWRKGLTEISWDLPNRIELRMMARYGLVDKNFLVEQLGKVGLAEEYRSVAADMMLAMGVRTDLSTRYSKGWINAEGVKTELAGAGLSEEVQTRMFQWIVKNVQTDRVAKERDLTVTDIIKGVKKGTITRAQGQTLLVNMGYDSTEAKFKLDINIPIEEEVKEVAQRQLSKTDILKAYRLGEIDVSEATLLLMDIRYSADNTAFLLTLVDATKVLIEEERLKELTKLDVVKGVKVGVITVEEGYIM
ncbi:hypothetical protein LCGC14_2845460, partial [marine sediment metagenome]